MDSKFTEDWIKPRMPELGHKENMERSVLRIIACALLFIGVWMALAYFLIGAEPGLKLLDKLLPIITLFIGYLANDAVRHASERKK